MAYFCNSLNLELKIIRRNQGRPEIVKLKETDTNMVNRTNQETKIN